MTALLLTILLVLPPMLAFVFLDLVPGWFLDLVPIRNADPFVAWLFWFLVTAAGVTLYARWM